MKNQERDEIMDKAIDTLIEKIKDDYRGWGKPVAENDEIAKKVRREMIENFNQSIRYDVGNKYIKIIQDHSVWGFVVNTEKDKSFNYGDILKAASWKTPARNFARGNVFDIDNFNACWTGAQ
jgi:hypothetical protein